VLSDFGALALVKLGRAIMGFVTSLHVYWNEWLWRIFLAEIEERIGKTHFSSVFSLWKIMRINTNNLFN
jgi:hypothetical protein